MNTPKLLKRTKNLPPQLISPINPNKMWLSIMIASEIQSEMDNKLYEIKRQKFLHLKTFIVKTFSFVVALFI